MKKALVLLAIILCHVSIWADTQVFMTPIEQDKVEVLQNSKLFNSPEEQQLLKDVGLSKYYRWIQNIQNQNVLIHLVQGQDLSQSFDNIKDQIAAKNPTALKLQELYIKTLDCDLGKDNFLRNNHPITQMITFEKEDPKNSKEYAFVYPLIPNKMEELRDLFQGPNKYPTKQDEEIARARGIAKMQIWMQNQGDKPYLVIYQEIQGPVSEAREKFREHIKKIDLSPENANIEAQRTKAFANVTGLSYEDLLPKLQSLQDKEVLN